MISQACDSQLRGGLFDHHPRAVGTRGVRGRGAITSLVYENIFICILLSNIALKNAIVCCLHMFNKPSKLVTAFKIIMENNFIDLHKTQN